MATFPTNVLYNYFVKIDFRVSVFRKICVHAYILFAITLFPCFETVLTTH